MVALDPNLYPDVHRAGSLANVITELARQQGLDVGEVTTAPGSFGFDAASLSSARGGIGVWLSFDVREFSLNINGNGHRWSFGRTDALTDVVHAIAYWRQGVTLKELNTRFPFMEHTRMEQAFEDGNYVEVRWEMLCADNELTAIRPVLLAARRHPVLAGLYPTVGHLTSLYLAVDHADSSAGSVEITMTGTGGFRVENRHGVHDFSKLADVIEFAATQIPKGATPED